MNILEAKKQIKNTIQAYLTKDKYDNYIISIEKQRPVFLIGAPGIGKTAIMEQIAKELNIALLTYTMTHHTRQSALGLPMIEKRMYNGKEYTVSEYTMSEIISAIYEKIEQTKMKEGILFLDEINCVSETLAPSMLQFLQYKTFGKHQVPQGWVVVTAGNPPEFNDSVREFDVVTWDRLKRIDVEPDFEVWKKYAYTINVHNSVITYLDYKKTEFFKVEKKVDGKSFVTARGWVDLSEMIKLYEHHNFPVTEDLIKQYVQDKEIAKNFAIYYDLYNKYKSSYQISEIINGKMNPEIISRAENASFDERLIVISLFIENITEYIINVWNMDNLLTEFKKVIKFIKTYPNIPNLNFNEVLNKKIIEVQNDIEISTTHKTKDKTDIDILRNLVEILIELKTKFVSLTKRDEIVKILTDKYNAVLKQMKIMVTDVQKKLSNVFEFFRLAFGEGNEIIIFITEISISEYFVHFLAKFGSDEYHQQCAQLSLVDKQFELTNEINELMLDE